MIEIADEWYSWKDFAKMFDVLKNGGFIRVGTFGIKVDKPTGGAIRCSIIATGKTIDEKVYLKTMTTTRTKKVKAQPKVVDSGISKKGGLFG